MGKSIKGIRAAIFVIATISLCFLTLAPQLVLADITNPDTCQIKSAKFVRNLYETGDVLLVFDYQIDWDVPENFPDLPVDETFIFRLMDEPENNILGQCVGYPYVYYGYVEGCASMYWDTASARAWGETVILRIEENPALDSSPYIVKKTLTGAEYSAFTEKSDNQNLLKDYLVDLALDLETAWGVPGEIISTSNYLTAAGETYFQGAIPGLRAFCPDIFSIKTTTPEVTYIDWTGSQQTAYEGQWAGTWIADSLQGLSDLFGGAEWGLVTGMAFMGLFIAILIFCYVKFDTARPGLLLGSIALIGGSRLGLFPLALLGVMTFGYILYMGYTFFIKGAS